MLETLPTETITYLTSISSEVLALGGAVLFLVALGLAKGKGELLALLVALYPAAIVASTFPYWSQMPFRSSVGDDATMNAVVVFGLGTLLGFFVLRGFISGLIRPNSLARTLETLMVALIVTGTGMALAATLLNTTALYPLSPLALMLFSGQVALFWWIVGGLGCLGLIIRN